MWSRLGFNISLSRSIRRSLVWYEKAYFESVSWVHRTKLIYTLQRKVLCHFAVGSRALRTDFTIQNSKRTCSIFKHIGNFLCIFLCLFCFHLVCIKNNKMTSNLLDRDTNLFILLFKDINFIDVVNNVSVWAIGIMSKQLRLAKTIQLMYFECKV